LLLSRQALEVSSSSFFTSIRSVYAYPEGDDAELLKIDFKQTKVLFDDQHEELKKQEILAFLSDSIPGFRYRAKKEKFIKLFEKRVT